MALKSHASNSRRLPTSFDALVRLMPPMAVSDDVQHQNVVEMVDRLMQVDNLSAGQSIYLETLVELVEAYEARTHAVDVSGLGGMRMLKHLLEQSKLSAIDLAKLLEIHPTMGSKILRGDRRLTWEHAKVLGERFRVAPSLLMD